MFPKGGGEINLNQYIKKQGSFFLSFPKEQFEEMPSLSHFYFISKMPKKTIDQEVFGLGCGQWVDLSGSYKKFTKSDFFKLNTTEQRYLYTAAGYYIFVFRKAQNVYLTHLHLYNEDYKDLECPDLTNDKIR